MALIPPPSWSGGAVKWGPNEAPKLAHTENLLLTFGFHCNLACTFCLVEDGLDRLHGITPETFRSWLVQPELFRGVSRIILSGGEATLEPALFEYIAIARKVPGVEHVRIQTNATRLGDRDYLQRLIDAGVDEFFVSVHGWDEPSTARITQRQGAFRAIVKGMEAVAQSPATLLTNTCICADNYRNLPDIVALIAPFRPELLSFWTLHLRVDRPDTRLALARVGDVQPDLLQAVDACDAAGVPSLVKWFPRCLLGPHAAKHDDSQPTTLVEPAFWPAVPRYSCIWRTACEYGKQGCNGLQHPYVDAFGWEEEVLRPIAPGQQQVPHGDQELPLDAQAQGNWAQVTAALGLPALLARHGWSLAGAGRRGRGLQQTVVQDTTGATATLTFEPARAGPALVTTASFSVSHGPGPAGAHEAFSVLWGALKRELPSADGGGLRVPWAG